MYFQLIKIIYFVYVGVLDVCVKALKEYGGKVDLAQMKPQCFLFSLYVSSFKWPFLQLKAEES